MRIILPLLFLTLVSCGTPVVTAPSPVPPVVVEQPVPPVVVPPVVEPLPPVVVEPPRELLPEGIERLGNTSEACVIQVTPDERLPDRYWFSTDESVCNEYLKLAIWDTLEQSDQVHSLSVMAASAGGGLIGLGERAYMDIRAANEKQSGKVFYIRGYSNKDFAPDFTEAGKIHTPLFKITLRPYLKK